VTGRIVGYSKSITEGQTPPVFYIIKQDEHHCPVADSDLMLCYEDELVRPS
jgi:hypothetical protein